MGFVDLIFALDCVEITELACAYSPQSGRRYLLCLNRIEIILVSFMYISV